MRPPQDEDDTGGEPVFLIRPTENVYSYFMFIGPTQSKKPHTGSIDWDVVMGYVLVGMNFFMQGILLYLIFHEVVVDNVEWQNGILKLGSKDHIMGLFSEGGNGCNDGGALCFHDYNSGNYTCSPPSLQLTQRWAELDTDGNGIWTRKEVEAARESLKCKYAVDPVEVYEVLVNMLALRESLIWLHPEVKAGTALHKPYFDYAIADLRICGYRSKDMCSNLIERGFFDAPMQYGTSPRVGNTIDSALRYCNSLLMPGGTCESLLPSTYTVWKVQSNIECGEADYEKFVKTNPGSGVTKSLLQVDYAVRQEYELAQDTMFRIFKSIMLFTWLLLMLVEYRDITKILTLCMRFPDASDYGDDAVIVEADPSDPEDIRYRIQGITSNHRTTMFILSVLRFGVTCVLLVVGVSYLIKTNGYADLIMNGVALVFIAEVSAVLYSQVLREEVKDQTEDIKAIKVPMYGIQWLNVRPALVDIIQVLALCVVVWIIMNWQMSAIVMPVYEALECTCLSTGDKCIEAQTYDFEWWHNYWLNAVPAVYQDVEKLKAAAGAAAASYLAVGAKEGAKQLAGRAGMEQRIEQLELDIEKSMKRVEALELKVPSTHAVATPVGHNSLHVQPKAASHRHGARGLARR